MNSFRLHVEAERVLQLLSSQIYDSPYAMLRENVQNAYDATLMRATEEHRSPTDFTIKVVICDGVVEFIDQGIGMTEKTLTGNYWSAGSSGKNTELARKAGVVGTFGIGAMANFGVASRLEVETQHLTGSRRLYSGVYLANLTLDSDCIDLRETSADSPGTLVRVTLQEGKRINQEQATKYLEPFVRYLQIPVRVGEKVISQSDFFGDLKDGSHALGEVECSSNGFKLRLAVAVNPSTSSLRVRCDCVELNGKAVGRLALKQDGQSIDGLRSGFRLAGLPVPSPYKWGGRLDISLLTPTAGREALTRNSIALGSSIIAAIDTSVSKLLAQSNYCDKNAGFLQYLRRHWSPRLAENVTIKNANDEDIRLNDVQSNNNAHYYSGSDPATIAQFASGMTLLLISNRQPRKWIQERWLREHSISEIPDHAQVTDTYVASELTHDELALKMRLELILSEDYLIPRPSLQFAEISHNVTVVVDSKDAEAPVINLKRNGPGVPELLQVRSATPTLFGPFAKDFVRNYIFRHVQDLVPSATRQGTEELKRILNKRKELYRYEPDEVGRLDPLLEDFFAGKVSLDEVVRRGSATRNVGRQRVNANQVGSIQTEIPMLSRDTPPPSADPATAMPGILRLETDTKMKVLVADEDLPDLGGFRTFLGLTDKASAHERDFFVAPHYTRVIWAQHRVVFVFQVASGDISFYYDVELREPLDGPPGGSEVATTTLITKSRVFVPVPREIESAFSVQSGKKEFFVRYDYV